MAVLMELSRIFIRELNDYQLIELREVEGDRSFPILIGLPEAQAIERRLKGEAQQLGGETKSTAINDLAEHTFFATLNIRRNGEVLRVDSRPSDAIAIGVATGAPIYVEEHVLDAAQNAATS